MSCIVCGVPCMCITHTPAPVSTATSIIAGSPASPVTSLMISAPASIAARATAALLVSIEIGTSHLRASCSNDRQHACKFFVGGNRLRIRPRAFAADVEHIGAVGHQLQAMRDGRIRIEKLPAVGKAIRRDVDDAHHQRPPRQLQRARAQLPHGSRGRRNR